MLDLAAIHTIFKTELRTVYPDIQITREGSNRLDDPTPRVSYLPISEGVNPRQSIKKTYTDPGGLPTTTYIDWVYDKYRYNLIVDNDAGTDTKSPLQVLRELSRQFLWFIRSQSFETQLQTIGVRYTLLTDIQEVIIQSDQFSERRNYIDLLFGHIDTFEKQEGSFIETVDYENTN